MSTVVTFLSLLVEKRLLTRSVDTVDSTGPDNQLVDGLKYIKNTVTKHPSMKVPRRRGRRILWKDADGILCPKKSKSKKDKVMSNRIQHPD